jgi:hypothetical protein
MKTYIVGEKKEKPSYKGLALILFIIIIVLIVSSNRQIKEINRRQTSALNCVDRMYDTFRKIGGHIDFLKQESFGIPDEFYWIEDYINKKGTKENAEDGLYATTKTLEEMVEYIDYCNNIAYEITTAWKTIEEDAKSYHEEVRLSLYSRYY